MRRGTLDDRRLGGGDHLVEVALQQLVALGQQGVGQRARAFGMEIAYCNRNPAPGDVVRALDAEWLPLERLLEKADVVTLHTPLSPATHHLINGDALAQMKPGVMLINTGRGALIDSRALIDALKRQHVGSAGLDVYEEEEGVFFEDLSDQVLQDDVLARLLTFPNVLVTAHQGFLTHEALAAIAATTLANLDDVEAGRPCPNRVAP